MPRYRATIEYDGAPYCGFQLQDGQPSVQAELERAIHAFSGEAARVYVAGRTDTGVHATGQVIHFDLDKAWPTRTVMEATNAHLVPEPVAVLSVEEMTDPEFHARFSAKGRRYLYRVLDRRAPAALERNRVWLVKTPLAIEPMREAAALLVGTHDFTTFRDVGCQSKSPVKTLDVVTVDRVGAEVHFRFEARSFLHRQVRSMTGALVHVGAGRWKPAQVGEALAAADRQACPPVAPSTGLYLTGVEY